MFLNNLQKLDMCSVRNQMFDFDVLLTLRLNIFISVINQLDAQNFVLQQV